MKEFICRDKLSDDLFLLVSEKLDRSGAARVQEHLESCETCRERVSTLGWIHDQVKEHGTVLFDSHVASEELVRLAEGGGALTPERLRVVERHLTVCEACESDLGMLREVEETIQDPATTVEDIAGRAANSGSFLNRTQGWLRALVTASPAPRWAYAVMAVLLVPAAIGIRSILEEPGQERSIRSVPVIQRIALSEERGETGPTQISLSGRGDMVLAVEVPIRGAPGVRYAGTLRDASDTVLWEDEDLKSVDRFGTMLLLIPQETLRPGLHEILVVETNAGPPQEFRFVFDVVGER